MQDHVSAKWFMQLPFHDKPLTENQKITLFKIKNKNITRKDDRIQCRKSILKYFLNLTVISILIFKWNLVHLLGILFKNLTIIRFMVPPIPLTIAIIFTRSLIYFIYSAQIFQVVFQLNTYYEYGREVSNC